MRKLLLIAIVTLCTALFAVTVHAQDNKNIFNDACNGTSGSTLCEEASKQPNSDSNPIFGKDGILTKATQIITIVTGVAAVLMVIVGGLKYALSGGDSNKVNSAKDTVLYALVGVMVAIVAQGIIVLVLNKL